ncbi:hypothetical protein [Aquibium microcysteis]|uniref:hypothetical protein n=1 Tax=Aquibium microcysteis TaxID=675281 RepID=UPI00165D24CE|nr:hypothetical protein [Aquibium microcysteis]
MDGFFVFLKGYRQEIILLLVAAILFMGMVQWAFWIAGWGRFRPRADNMAPGREGFAERPIRFVFAELFAKLVNDFRHLLALIVMLVFLFSVAYALWVAGTNVDNMNKALQAVTGSLSGIIGVIIGYYFGETVARTGGAGDTTQPSGTALQGGAPEQKNGGPDDLGVAAREAAPQVAPRPAPEPGI